MNNVDLAKKWYDTLDPEMVSETIEWRLAEGFPADGLYHGRNEVFEVWWPKLAAQFSEWRAIPETYLDAGDAVVVLGHYAGVAKETGSSFKAPFSHVWWFKNGQITRMNHSANTLILDRAINGSAKPA